MEFRKGFTLGKKNPFEWKYTNDCIIIKRNFKNTKSTTKFSNSDLNKIINFIIKNDEVELSNNVKKLANGTEKIGLGSFIYNGISKDVTDAQAASQLASILCACRILSYNGAERGMKFKVKEKNWERILNNQSKLIIPHDINAKIWRYVDLAKMLSILDKESMFFTRSDKFRDPFEGKYPLQNTEGKKTIDCKKDTWINCWHLNKYESAAMWDLYQNSGYGIAIQSTFNRLENSLIGYPEIYISEVKYIDYKKNSIQDDHTLIPFLYKRKSFEHEKEIRAIIQGFSTNENGIYVETDIHNLVENIYISPLTPEWVVDIIKSITLKYGYEFNIKKSQLYNGNII